MESELELKETSGGKVVGREVEGGKEPLSVGDSEVGKVVSGKSGSVGPWEKEWASKTKKWPRIEQTGHIEANGN